MKKNTILKAWGRVLTGYYPAMSIEITRECPLRCPGCYAYEPEHLGETGPLRSVADLSGQKLIDGVLDLIERYRPLHVSIVGGEPLVRYRELDVLLPRLSELGVGVQVVTSAVRLIPPAWAKIKGLTVSVSIDGLQPEHDERRKPATYDRILTNIAGHQINVHCTITHQMTGRERYFEEFLTFWSAKPEVKNIWFSFFTPQIGEKAEENLSPREREEVLQALFALKPRFPKAYLSKRVLAGFRKPPESPSDCLFARTTVNITADLKSRINPCQFGGNPDCSQCGCIASAGLNVVANYRLFNIVSFRSIYEASDAIGKRTARMMGRDQ